MRLVERIKNWNLFQAGLKKFTEILNPGRAIDKDEANWTSLGKNTNRNLSTAEQNQTSDMAYFQWLTDPLAGRIVEILTDFVIGNGVTLKAEEPEVQEALDAMWYDDVNKFDEQQIAMSMEFDVFGELFILPYVNPVSGLVQFARIDPVTVKEVLPNPKFPQCPWKVILQRSNLVDRDGKMVDTLEIMHRDSDPRSPTAGSLIGDVFYFSKGRISGKRRGHTQLLRTHEWIDLYSKRHFNEAERQEAMSAFVWDVKLQGANEDTIKKFADETPSPQPGSIRVHNEDVEWNVLSPDLKASDFSESNRQFLRLILGAHAIPEHWFALGGDVNLATAKTMSEPTLRAFQRGQKLFKFVIESLVDYQIEQAVIARRIHTSNLEYEVIMDEVSTADLEGLSGAIQRIAYSLQTAEVQGWVAKEENAKAFAALFGQTGVSVDPLDEGDVPPPAPLLQAAEAFSRIYKGRREKKLICAGK